MTPRSRQDDADASVKTLTRRVRELEKAVKAAAEREAELGRKADVLDGMNRVFRERIRCESSEELAKTCLAVAEELTGSEFGYIGELNPAGLLDTIAISDPGWAECKIPNSEALKVINNMEIRGVDRSLLKDEKSRIVNDVPAHPQSVGIPEGHPPVHCFLGVPLKQGGRTIGMIGLANKEGGYDAADQEAVEALSVAIVEALNSKRTEQQLAQQTEEILELSTPVIQIWRGMLVAPVIGTLDSQRAQRLMEELLDRIVETRATVALVDITGVTNVDTQIAQHLIETISAVRLLGSQVILTGVSPAIAQTLAHLGIDLAEVTTQSSLASGLRIAFELLELEVTHREERAEG